MSLLVFEIDYFEFFKHAYGDAVGETCLQLVASTISEGVGDQSTFVAR